MMKMSYSLDMNFYVNLSSVIFNILRGISVHSSPTYLSELGMIHMIKTNLYTPKFILITSHLLAAWRLQLIAIYMFF